VFVAIDTPIGASIRGGDVSAGPFGEREMGQDSKYVTEDEEAEATTAEHLINRPHRWSYGVVGSNHKDPSRQIPLLFSVYLKPFVLQQRLCRRSVSPIRLHNLYDEILICSANFFLCDPAQ